jgi:hypothetical protein
MTLQDDAIRIIESLALKLDPLLKKHGFNVKLRNSFPAAFCEILGYEKDDIEMRLSACLHPHDYPNSFDIRLIKKIPYNYRYLNKQDLLNFTPNMQPFIGEEFLIEPETRLSESISRMYEFCEFILTEKIYLKIP